MMVNMKVPLAASACTRLPISMLRWVMTPSNGATTLLIGLLLVQHLQLRLLGHDIGLRDARPRPRCACRVWTSIVALLLRCTQPFLTSGLSRSQVTWARSRLACACCSVALS